MSFFYLSSALLLGWALGANDASNVFGTAVATRMVSFRTASIISGIFIILGAVFSGAGTAQTLEELGAANMIGGAFIETLSAAIAVYLMTRARLPVSVSQAIVGAILGWTLFSGMPPDYASLIKIVVAWVASPIISAIFAIILFGIIVSFLHKYPLNIFRQDMYTRLGLLFAGAFASYALGANNIGNVMGVFIPVSPFSQVTLGGIFVLSSTTQLFILGGAAITFGVFTYSQRVMFTVGRNLLKLTPVTAFIVVLAHSLTLLLFSSRGLNTLLDQLGLPNIPLVPVSSSQAIVGAVLGVGFLKRGHGIQWKMLVKIAAGWVVTPVISAIICIAALFIWKNILHQPLF